MSMNVTPLTCHGQAISCVQSGALSPDCARVVLCGTGLDDAMLRALRRADLPKSGFLLIFWETPDWDGALSPWKAVCGERTFAGNGKESLSFLTDALLPFVEKQYGLMPCPPRTFLAGYSLGGWFSLWAALESGRFGGAASCSGSLWFPGALDYLKAAEPPEGFAVYLSLGKKEPQSGPPLMRTVGAATKEAALILSAHPHVRRCRFVWENGTHFTEPNQRIIRALSDLLCDPV